MGRYGMRLWGREGGECNTQNAVREVGVAVMTSMVWPRKSLSRAANEAFVVMVEIHKVAIVIAQT